MTNRTGKLSVREKAGYSLGDGAANFVFMTMILFQLNFYTDTMGIAAGIAGTLLLVGRFWDAFFDPMMGVLADRTSTRWGKFRPWVLWTSLPWAIAMVLAYTVPGFRYGPTLVYAAVTNILLMTLYSANNTPYSAMTAVMTGDVNERTSLSAYRFVAALIAQLIVGGFTLPLVAKFGQGNNAKGWQMTIGLWALICVVCFVITFLSTRERIQPLAQVKVSIRQSFGTLGKIGPWIAMFVVTLAHFTANSMRDGTVIYFFQYYVNKDRLFDFLRGAGLPYAADGSSASGWWFSLLNAFGLVINAAKSNVSAVGFSLWNISGQFVLVIGVLFSTYLSIKFGKKVVALCWFRADHGLHGRLHFSTAGQHLGDLRDGLAALPGLCADDPAAVGHVCRCGGLLGMEDRPAHDGRDLRDRPVRSQAGLEPGRLPGGLAALGVWLSAQGGPDGARPAGYSPHRQHLSRHPVLRHRGGPMLLLDH